MVSYTIFNIKIIKNIKRSSCYILLYFSYLKKKVKIKVNRSFLLEKAFHNEKLNELMNIETASGIFLFYTNNNIQKLQKNSANILYIKESFVIDKL